MQFATHRVGKQNIFQVFVLSKFYLNDVSVITRYQLQSVIKEISEVPLRFCESSPTM